MDSQSAKQPFYKNKKFLYGVGIFFAIGIVGSALDTPSPAPTPVTIAETTPEPSQKPQTPVVDEQKAKQEAQAELDKVMELSKTAGLISSYEFSDKASVVYADKAWYTQTVTFKKDFLAKVSSLKKTITGYHRFEVLDAYSNEKLAEVTAFSGSLEVYK